MTTSPRTQGHRPWRQGLPVVTVLLVLCHIFIGSAQATAAPDRILRIALASGSVSADPHRHLYTPDVLLSSHIYDSLVSVATDGQIVPQLAREWVHVRPDTWEFTLQNGVVFHDGSPLQAHDAVASIMRARAVQDSPMSYGDYLSGVIQAEAPSPHILRIRTAHPMPDLPGRLAALKIIPEMAATATREDFDRLKQKIGSGPYQLEQINSREQITILRANPRYWGTSPRWDTVILQVIPDDATRVTALVSGQADILEQLPPADAARFMRNHAYTVAGLKADRLLFLAPDTRKRRSPFVSHTGRTPIHKNPMSDPRVRQAMSLAINRKALTDDILRGFAEPADTVLPSSTTIQQTDPDQEQARELIHRAGWPNGFSVTLHLPEQRYVSDLEIANALALQLSRIGITVTIETVDPEIFFRTAGAGGYSLMFSGIAMDLSTPLHPATSLLGSTQKMNRTGWESRRMDELLAAGSTAGPDELKKLGAGIQFILDAEMPLVPIYRQIPLYAMRANLTMQEEGATNLADTVALARPLHQTVSDAGR